LLREWKSGDERGAEILFDRYAMRLVVLVASRLNRSDQTSIDPNDVVRSAMGSFFDAASYPDFSDVESVPRPLCDIMKSTLRKSPAERSITISQIVDLLACVQQEESSSWRKRQ
tara:strand:- start:267 stop:608 length:342 start_codon:yes stop_codon:yes gene_type:complete